MKSGKWSPEECAGVGGWGGREAGKLPDREKRSGGQRRCL